MNTVFHDIRGERIYLCISTPSGVEESAKCRYSVEREVDPANCSAASIRALVAEMEEESGMKLELSEILRREMGI